MNKIFSQCYNRHMIICRVIKTNLGHKGELDLWYYAEISLFELLIGQNGGPLQDQTNL